MNATTEQTAADEYLFAGNEIGNLFIMAQFHMRKGWLKAAHGIIHDDLRVMVERRLAKISEASRPDIARSYETARKNIDAALKSRGYNGN